MTEQEWLTGTDPQALFVFARDATVTYQTRWQGPRAGKRFVIPERKFRLCLLACLARVAHLWPNDRLREFLHAAEEHCDGLLSDARYDEVKARCVQPHPSVARTILTMTVLQQSLVAKALQLVTEQATGSEHAFRWATIAQVRTAPSTEVPHRLALEQAIQADLVRDILGNIFAPVHFASPWCSPEARNIAEVISRESRFEDLPVLADALEDAGCVDHSVLHHCRAPGHHARGCWVVDRVVGR